MALAHQRSGGGEVRKGKTCKVEGCHEQHHCKGYCSVHYNQTKRHGKIMRLGKVARVTGCKVDGCNEKHEAKGYCRDHYFRKWKYGDPLCEKGVKWLEPKRWVDRQIKLIKANITDGSKCITWPYASMNNQKDGNTYGCLVLSGAKKRILPHRYVIQRTLTPCEDTKFTAYNRCGNTLCVNPYHYKIKIRDK